MSEVSAQPHHRLYQDLARKIVAELIAGKYPVGSRLPAERELAMIYEVSRPTVREAVIALEVQGLVEVRIGSGAYVVRLPQEEDMPGSGLSAFELTEARLLIEGEAAALAATQASDAEIAEIAALLDAIDNENRDPAGAELADRAFHLAIARATGNGAIAGAIESLWDLRESSPEAALLHAKARTANVKPVVAEHSAVLDAIRARDAGAAREAMRAHLSAVIDALLFDTDEGEKRARYAAAPARGHFS